jgi:hypothetical protein
VLHGAALLHDHRLKILVHINPRLDGSSAVFSSFIVSANHSAM